MNQRELIRLICNKTKEPKAKVIHIVETMLTIIDNTILEGDKVSITKLGTFKLKERRSRIGYNPYHAKRIDIPSSREVDFRINKYLKEILKEKMSNDYIY